MNDIELRTNYNVLLWHFVDMVSRWDYFVEPFIYNHFRKHWGITEQDQHHIKEYSKKRKLLEWDKEIELFEWAYKDFPKNNDFSPLSVHIHHFEERRNDNNKTLKAVLTEQLEVVRNCREYIEKKLSNTEFKELIKKISSLVGTKEDTQTTITAYLATSLIKGSCQGGANGDGIYAEVPPGGCDIAYQSIVHEYLHKRLSPHKYFQNISQPDLRKLYHSKIDEVYTDEIYHFLEEIVIHSTADVIMFGANPEEEAEQARKMEEIDEVRRRRHAHIWTATNRVTPIIQEYLSGKLETAEAQRKLNITIQEYLSNSLD